MKALLILLFGSLLYNYAMFVVSKDKCDKAEKPFPYKGYFWMNLDNWGLTVLVAIAIAIFPDVLVSVATQSNVWLTDKVGFGLPENLYYFSAGPLSELLIFALLWISQRKESFVPPVHKD